MATSPAARTAMMMLFPIQDISGSWFHTST